MLPKILFLTMESPRMPGTGGQVRTWFFAKELACVSELSLVSLGGSGGGASISEELKNSCHAVIECGRLEQAPQQVGGMKAWLALLRTLAFPWLRKWAPFLDFCMHFGGMKNIDTNSSQVPLRRRLLCQIFAAEYRILALVFEFPPLVTHLFTRNFEAILPQIARLCEDKRFDLLWVEHSMMMPFADRLQKRIAQRLPIICNAHNVEWVLNQRMAESATEPRERIRAAIQAQLLRRLEKKVFASTSLTIVCSEEDKQAALALVPKARVSVIGNGVDTSYFFRPEDAERSPTPTVLFTGSFGYGPNREGLHYFVGEVLPLIHAELPICRLVVAGAQAATAGEEMGIVHPSITWVSSPADIRPCFHEAWVAAVPLRSGGGTRLKILEAMAMECAVVSTSIGAEGIPCEHGRHILIANEPAAFARHVLDLLRDHSKRLNQQEVALAWVREHYEWEKLTSRLPEILMEAIHP